MEPTPCHCEVCSLRRDYQRAREAIEHRAGRGWSDGEKRAALAAIDRLWKLVEGNAGKVHL